MPSGTRKTRKKRRSTRVVGGASVCSLLLCGAPAAAQESFNVETFEPGPSSTSTLGVDSSAIPGHLKPSVDIVMHRSERPVVFRNSGVTAAVDNRWTLDLGMGLGLGALQLDARLPLVTTQAGVGIGNELDSVSAGDLRLRGKWRLLERDLQNPVGFALQGAVYVPTGDAGGFTSDGVVRLEPRMVADVELGPVLLMVNAGYQVRATRLVASYRHDDVVRWGLAARAALGGGFDAEASLFGEHSLMPANVDGGTTPNRFGHPVEALGGFGWTFQGFRTSLAGGLGLTRGVGAPAYRVIFGVGYSPFAARDEEVAGRTVIAHDFDEDGFAGDADACPYAPESFDGFEDLDGCPDDDDDNDGVADAVDLCPLEPGIAAKSGCPSVDADGDGIDDAADACPTLRGPTRSDGCPETRESEQWRSRFAVMSAGDCDPDDFDCTPSTHDIREEFPEAVFFPTGQDEFRPQEHPLIERIAVRMRDDPSIVKLIVEGHTDSVGDADYNAALSKHRAEKVVAVLDKEYGIDPERLDVAAFGEQRPLDSNESTEGRARNRRVSFQMVVRRRGREERIDDVPAAVELPTLTMADFEFDRRMLVGFRPPRFVEGATLTVPQGWLCRLGDGELLGEVTLATVGPPVVQGLRYPGWTSEQRLTCRQDRNIVAFDLEVEIPPFGVRGVWSGGVQLTSRRPTQIDLRFAGRAIPLEVDIAGFEHEHVAVSADVLRLRLRPNGRQRATSARLGAANRVLLNVPLIASQDKISVEPIPQQRRLIEIGGGTTFLATGRAFAEPGLVGQTAMPALRFTARALATNWFSVGGTLDVGGTLGRDPILFTPGIGAVAAFHLPTSLLRPFVSTGVLAYFPGLTDARPIWDNALGIDYEPASGAGIRASIRAAVASDDAEILLLPGGFLGAYSTF